MKRSTERILVPHADTPPRVYDLRELAGTGASGQPVDKESPTRHVGEAVAGSAEIATNRLWNR